MALVALERALQHGRPEIFNSDPAELPVFAARPDTRIIFEESAFRGLDNGEKSSMQCVFVLGFVAGLGVHYVALRPSRRPRYS